MQSLKKGIHIQIIISLYFLGILLYIFKVSALWVDAFYKLKCLSACPSVYVFTFEVLLKRLFVPTSQSQMSNIFRDSESLRKSNGKKWSQIRTFVFGSGLKLPRKKSLFFCGFCLTKHGGKPHFPMDYRPLVEGLIANFSISLDFLTF